MRRVLHIEDDVANRRLVHKLLTAAGFQVHDAVGGLEGVRLANQVQPDIVLVDINIPDMDGYEVTLRLRGIPELREVPIVAITAEGDKQTSLAVGCDGFIAKPIDARRFARDVERYLGGHREESDGGGEIRLREQSQKTAGRLEHKLRQLESANAQLEELARLRREYLRNVTHELATPMTPLVGYLSLFLDGELGPLTESQRRCLEAVHESTTRLRSVVDTLLDVSGFETGGLRFHSRAYDFLDLAREAVDELRRSEEAQQLTITSEPVAPGMPSVGDPDKLRRAMVHVIQNAVKFAPPGSEVTMAVRRLDHDGIVVAHPSQAASYSLLVADSAAGINEHQLARVFEPFYQVDGSTTRSHEGVGLGLAFARHVARRLGGDVTLESPPTEDVAGVRATGTLARPTVARQAVSEES